ncbi:P-loop containing nucleoside triphosphate hydrolase protein [Annulohypoxylon nitens]|nr:P-loop containing nucleoside triphosphate hydrolase protein [Annulohypoxylon nitens]
MDLNHESHYPSKRPRLSSHPDSTPYKEPFSRTRSITPLLQETTTDEKWVNYDAYVQQNHPSSSNPNNYEKICYGMVSNILGTCEQLGTDEIPSEFSVQLDSSHKFSIKENHSINGRIQSIYGQMIQGLLDESSLDLHVICVLNMQPTKNKPSHNSKLSRCMLEITVYGPLDLYDEIGSWFQEYEIYLQDPRTCHLDVKYYNPHRLSSDDLKSCPLVSELINLTSSLIPLKQITEQTDMLDVLCHSTDLEETLQPAAIRATLKRHQRQAFTFMLNREKSLQYGGRCRDIWETVKNDYGRIFVNTITSSWQTEEPPQFHGGIIADPMGLGKTLTMISLAATDLDARYEFKVSNIEDGIDRSSIPATLIIIPPPLIGTWEEQLTEHVFEDHLKFCRHHGKTRLESLAQLQNINLVLTTFHTVSSEWKANSNVNDSILFAVRWRRIILDEAHLIRNGNSRMSHAFEVDISNLWKSGDYEEAVRRLKRLSAFLLLRRPKGTINLPPRQDLLLPINFIDEERRVYDSMRDQVVTRSDEALHDASRGVCRTDSYRNALQQIESLRLFCNLGLRYQLRHNKDDNLPIVSNEWPRVAQRTFNSQREITPIICMQCSTIIEHTEEWLIESSTIRQSAQFFECLKLICGDCIGKLHRHGRPVACGHIPSCAVATISTNSNDLEEAPDPVASEMSMESIGLPSKIKALIMDIRNESSGAKCVVFSTWRLTLDIVQAGLTSAGIRSIRFDGKVAQRDRQPVIDSFRTDPSIKVMLLTLSCGAVGLTLTVASRAYLMEPHWNPTLEEQALTRVHRLGQTKEVTTVRLYVRDSFEEQVMQVQESKKQLAGVLLSPHDGKNMDSSLSGLEKLRTLL